MASTMTATVYPNPATGSYFDVSVEQSNENQAPQHEQVPKTSSLIRSKNLEYEYVLYNSQGDAVYQGKSNQAQFTVPSGSLPKGFYYLRIKGKEGEVTKHILITK